MFEGLEGLVIAFVGWMLIIYINSSSRKEAHISNLRDKLIEKIEASQDKIVAQVKSEPSNIAFNETSWSYSLYIIECRSIELNQLCKFNIVKTEDLLKLRLIDFEGGNEQSLILCIHEECSIMVEQVITTTQKLRNKNFFDQLLGLMSFYQGAFYALLAVYLFINLLQMMY
jgi:hypothetical protein